MFISKTRFEEIKKNGKVADSMFCPYCQSDLFGHHPSGVYRHDCSDGTVIYFLNGYVFVGVPEYNYLEKQEYEERQNGPSENSG